MLALWSRALVGAWFPPSPLFFFLFPRSEAGGTSPSEAPLEAHFETLTDGRWSHALRQESSTRSGPPDVQRRAALRRLRRACLRIHRRRSQQAIYHLPTCEARPEPQRGQKAHGQNTQRSLETLLHLLPWSDLAFLSRASAWAADLFASGDMQQAPLGPPSRRHESWVMGACTPST